MDSSSFLPIILGYVVVGLFVSLVFFYVFKIRVFRSFGITLGIAMVGAFSAGLLEVLMFDIFKEIPYFYSGFQFLLPLLNSSVLVLLFFLTNRTKD